MQRDYQIVRCDLGGWNVVDCTNVEEPRNGKIIRVTHPTRAQAERTLQMLREQAGGNA